MLGVLILILAALWVLRGIFMYVTGNDDIIANQNIILEKIAKEEERKEAKEKEKAAKEKEKAEAKRKSIEQSSVRAALSDEDTGFDVILKDAGDQKLSVVKAVKELTGLGLKEAKELVDVVPNSVKKGVPAIEAQEIKEILESNGGEVELVFWDPITSKQLKWNGVK
jgi:large subunit ribosomal protein L7/L12